MAGMGLPQPHVKRTELCDLDPSQLNPEYLSGLKRVRSWVAAHTLGGKAGGRVWRSGAELASQVTQLVGVLNAQRIPSAGSVIEAFNRELMQKVLAELGGAVGAFAVDTSSFTRQRTFACGCARLCAATRLARLAAAARRRRRRRV